LACYERHPNFAAILIIGLGCETNQIEGLLSSENLQFDPLVQNFNIQNVGGTSAAVAYGISLIESFLPKANAFHREPCSVEHLVVGLLSGGSDGYSRISASPALGNAVDNLGEHLVND
jgi:altronate hydrolase